MWYNILSMISKGTIFMKKHLTAVVIILAALLSAISFCSCTGKHYSDVSAQSDSGAADTSQSIVGTWALQLYGDEYTYTFNPDGTGVYNAAGKIMNLTYTTKDGIYYETFEGSTAAVKRPYRIENNQFIVEDSYGEEIVYTKK